MIIVLSTNKWSWSLHSQKYERCITNREISTPDCGIHTMALKLGGKKWQYIWNRYHESVPCICISIVKTLGAHPCVFLRRRSNRDIFFSTCLQTVYRYSIAFKNRQNHEFLCPSYRTHISRSIVRSLPAWLLSTIITECFVPYIQNDSKLKREIYTVV